MRVSLCYQSRRPDDAVLKLRIRDLAASRVRYGYRRIHVLLRREGWVLNHKKVYRLYTLEGLSRVIEVLDQWAHQHGVKLQFSHPGKPTANAMIETFNAKVRAECLDQHWFASLEEAREQVEAWRQGYMSSVRTAGAFWAVTTRHLPSFWPTGSASRTRKRRQTNLQNELLLRGRSYKCGCSHTIILSDRA